MGAERILVALLPESETIAAAFQNAGVPVSRRDGHAVRTRPSTELAERLSEVGKTEALGLSGHAKRSVGPVPPGACTEAQTACWPYLNGHARQAGFLPDG